MATTVERERLAHRIQAIQSLMESLSGAKKEELQRVLAKYQETLKMLDAKGSEMAKENESSLELDKEK